jgi:hypothetical protein
VTPSADEGSPVIVEFVARNRTRTRNRNRNRDRTVSSAATLAAQQTDTTSGRNGTVSAQFILTPNFAFAGWSGWSYLDNSYYYNYYQYWREYYFLRNLYMNLRIPPKVNPCKFYKDWALDNTVTFGAVVSRRGVIEFASTPQVSAALACRHHGHVCPSSPYACSFDGATDCLCILSGTDTVTASASNVTLPVVIMHS